jgi:SAM-dependent methyltransferase
LAKLTSLVPERIRHTVKLWLHRGHAVTCPFCGYEARDLAVSGHDLPVLREKQVIGAGRRPVNCYRCGSGDRARLVYLYLRDRVGFERAESMRVLHVAPERVLRETLAEVGFGEYVCGDLLAEGYRYPSWVQHLDATDIHFPDDTFDVIICNHVLEHIPDDRRAMRELCRVLKPGGVAVLQVPISANSPSTVEDPSIDDPAEQERRFGQWDHVRLYGQDYVDRLGSAGLSVGRVDVTGDYARFGVNPDEELFVCTK